MTIKFDEKATSYLAMDLRPNGLIMHRPEVLTVEEATAYHKKTLTTLFFITYIILSYEEDKGDKIKFALKEEFKHYPKTYLLKQIDNYINNKYKTSLILRDKLSKTLKDFILEL